MKKEEKMVIKELDAKYRPMGAWKFFFLQVLYAIPVIGLICLIVHAIGSKNITKRSFARSYFVAILVSIILTVIAAIVVVVMGIDVQAMLNDLQAQIPQA